MVNIPKDFREFIQLLNEKKVEYILVGGYAVAFHGYSRFTGDIDLFFKPTLENARKLLQVLEVFGFLSLGITIEDLTEPDQIIQLGRPPLRIVLLNSIDGVSFSEAHAHHAVLEDEQVEIPVINYQKLLLNKKRSGRAKDLADYEELSRD